MHNFKCFLWERPRIWSIILGPHSPYGQSGWKRYAFFSADLCYSFPLCNFRCFMTYLQSLRAIKVICFRTNQPNCCLLSNGADLHSWWDSVISSQCHVERHTGLKDAGLTQASKLQPLPQWNIFQGFLVCGWQETRYIGNLKTILSLVIFQAL